jgi:hypothetical protein
MVHGAGGAAYQATCGVSLMTAVTLVVEIGDVRCFDNPPTTDGLPGPRAFRDLDR